MNRALRRVHSFSFYLHSFVIYEFNETSSNNYRTALELASSIAKGLAEVQSGKGFQAASGTFHIEKLNMEWAKPIQVITEEKARKAENVVKDGEMCGRPSAWDEFKSDVGDVLQSAGEFLQGAGNTTFENITGLKPSVSDELENKLTYQAGNLFGNVFTGIVSIVEIYGAISFIGGVNLLTLVAGAGTFGAATSIVVPLDIAATAAGVGVLTHGGYVWSNTIQNGKDTIQKIQSSSSSGGRVNKPKEGKNTKGIENVKQGDKSSLAPDGGLAAHELKGGHLIERHVGKTDEQLLERLKTNPKITGSSTFKDRMTAEKVANAVLSDSKNIEKIQKWLSDLNSKPTLPLKYKGDGEIIGRSVSRNSEVVENVTNAKVILKKNNDGSFILTGYPVK
ncbi:RNase A-like domain-containing protein [Bacillus manliponensis]|uniref:RNase A-like domain-containing protein n=1 Tax=Bacillus manliponensis TaxID=574376 RepID=UPI0035118CFE